MSAPRSELLRGTLDLLVLKVLASGPAHGYAIARHILARSEGVLLVEEGSLYPALHRLERQGSLEAAWGPSEENRRAKYYRLSRAGRRELVFALRAEAEYLRQAAQGSATPFEIRVGDELYLLQPEVHVKVKPKVDPLRRVDLESF